MVTTLTSPQNVLRFVHQNVQGINSKFSLTEILVDLLSPTVLCLSEHFLKHEELNEFSLPGYIVATGFCRSGFGKGGVCILVKESIPFSVVDVSGFCVEGCCEFAAITLDAECISYFLLTIYRPPINLVGKIDIFLEQLNKCLNVHAKANRRIIVNGDFNIDLSVCDTSSRKLRELMLSYGLHQTVASYTREFLGSKSIIDHVYCNLSPSEMNTDVVISGVSDHHAQVFDVFISAPLNETLPKFRQKRCFSDENVLVFRELVRRETWIDTFSSKTLNSKFDSFLSTMNFCFDQAFPLIKSRVVARKYFTKIKLNPSLSLLREEMLHMYFLTRDLRLTHPLRKSYVELKRKYRSEVKAAKANRVLTHLDSYGNRPKAIWSVVNETIPKKSSKPYKQLVIENDEGVLTNDSHDIACSFNNFFSSFSDRVYGSKDPTALKTCHKLTSISPTLFLHPTNETEVLNVIRDLNNSSAAGPDRISSKLIKKVAEFIAGPLCHLINASFVEGAFPESLKSAIVKPVFKKGDETKKDNYRPISITSSFSKIFEKLFLNRLHPFLVRNSVLFSNQFGFRKNMSTTDALFSFVSNVSRALDEHKHVFGIFFDLTKAFDMVNHRLLLSKLSNYGLRGKSFDWLSDFLLGRKQSVEVPFVDKNGCYYTITSHEAVVTSGVPQGTVLGPILFLLFINDMPHIISDANLCLFADDTSLCVSDVSRENLEAKSFIQSSTLLQWLAENHLVFNPGKTSFIDFSLRNSGALSVIPLGDKDIVSCHSTSFLGVIIDSRLDFSIHIEKVSKKISSSIFLLRRLSLFGSKEILLTAYFGCLLPHLQYGIAIWGAESSKTKKIFSLQKKAVRIIFGMDYLESCRGVFSANNLLTFPSIYIFECLVFFFKNQHFFPIRKSTRYNFRHSKFIDIPYHNTTSFQNQTLYSVTKLFNALPDYLKHEVVLVEFKKKLKAFLISKEFYSVKDFLNHRTDI